MPCRHVDFALWALLGLGVVFGVHAPVDAHPGGTDENGCHHCRSSCEKWNLEKDERHCHGDETEDEEESEKSDVSLEEDAKVYVDKVLDGDTLIVRPTEGDSDRIRIRILGIDCPESHKNPKCRRQGENGGPTCKEQIPRGLKAAKKVADLIKHEVVTLESRDGDGDFDRGGYGRILAYVRLSDGRDLGKFLVSQGLCRDYGDKYPHPRHDAYDAAEDDE